jgi:hypothetical protein
VGAALAGTDPAQALAEAQAKADAYLACLAGDGKEQLLIQPLQMEI